MFQPSPDDERILDATRKGDLETLREIAATMDDMDAFRRKCEILNDAAHGRRALHNAAGFGRIKICKFLIEEVKVDIDIKTDDGNTSLLLAIHKGHVHTAKYLIKRGASITMSDPIGLTLLHYAAIIDNKELMQLFLLKGANINLKSASGTPLEVATGHGNVESVKFLLARGAMLNSDLQPSASLLMLAISSRSPECLDLLLRVGADPNSIASSTTPLIHAVKHGVVEFLNSLLRAGSDPNQVDMVGLAPIEYAACALNNEIVKILFPVTRRIQTYPNWSVYGLMDHFQSEKGHMQIEQRRNSTINAFKRRGTDAMTQKNFREAAKWYSEAINCLGSSDALLLLVRSICYSELNEDGFALSDVMACIKLQPDLALAHYRKGMSWWKLKNYRQASCAFRQASLLDPHDRTVQNAFLASVSAQIAEMSDKYPLECSNILARFRLL